MTRPDGTSEPRFLHTSPEFACKKLLAAGETRIYTFAPVYRNREQGPLHAPEFTMLEWYRAGAPYHAVMDDCMALVRLSLKAAGFSRLSYRGGAIDPTNPVERLSVAAAFQRYSEIDLMACIRPDGSGDEAALRAQAQAAGLALAQDDRWPDIFSKVLSARIEPNLGQQGLTLLYDYPVVEAALARPCPRDPRLAERFELYALGVELANGFGELTDPLLQRARFEEEMAEKQRVHGERYPLDEDFLRALGQMPEASGVALGFDRLVMLATGAPRVEHVIWTPYR